MWYNPLPSMNLHPSLGSEDFRTFEPGNTGVPVGPDHPGSFGYKRKHHYHEGVDLYCPEGTPVAAVEFSVVVAVVPFTGAHATPPSPWWHNTWAVLLEGESGVVVYGEINPLYDYWPGDRIEAGEIIGHVTPVLIEDKGRPQSMLHLELHKPGTKDVVEWVNERPETLLDPTEHLLMPLSYVGRTLPSD
jgi:murein DD-endopeptidase MepM/ murein hydrolase activator NlpD